MGDYLEATKGYRPLGVKQLLQRMVLIGVLHLLPNRKKQEKGNHSRSRGKKGS
jgi:hypothetical protein